MRYLRILTRKGDNCKDIYKLEKDGFYHCINRFDQEKIPQTQMNLDFENGLVLKID